MTDDPVKLYVLVMAILIGVVGYIANTSYKQATAFEQAITDSPTDAKRFRERAASVTGLIRQLKQSKLADMDHITLVETAAQAHLRGKRRLSKETPKKIPNQKGKELRWKVDISRSSTGGGGPVSRNEVARFCRQVELDSRGILKVIEIELRRYTGQSGNKIGSDVEIRDDKYAGHVIVGMRVVD
jgi:hypothetical protein